MVPIQNPPDAHNTNDTSAEHGEQDADDEAAEDTDDTRSVNIVIWFCLLSLFFIINEAEPLVLSEIHFMSVLSLNTLMKWILRQTATHTL